MEFKGELTSINRDWSSGSTSITLSLTNATDNKLNELNTTAGLLDVKIKKHRKKRSLSANAYAWQLIGKIAEKLKSSKEETYEQMLSRYGANEADDDSNMVMFSLLDSIDVSKYRIHCAYVGKGHVHDKVFNHYRLIKGSSEYNSKEMSIFIEGIVGEAKNLEIETLPPHELERMVKIIDEKRIS